MLKANISLYVEKRGQDSCQPLLDAGTNWYDAKAEIDFLLEEENRFSLRITPLNGGEIRDVEIALTGLPQRPARTTRIHLQIDMADLTTLRLNMEDFGFGEFFPDAPVLGEDDFDRASRILRQAAALQPRRQQVPIRQTLQLWRQNRVQQALMQNPLRRRFWQNHRRILEENHGTCIFCVWGRTQNCPTILKKQKSTYLEYRRTVLFLFGKTHG